MDLSRKQRKQTRTAHLHKKRTVEASLNEQIKWEVAEELGLLDKIKLEGWDSLSAIECGRIGGKVRQRLQKLELNQ